MTTPTRMAVRTLVAVITNPFQWKRYVPVFPLRTVFKPGARLPDGTAPAE